MALKMSVYTRPSTLILEMMTSKLIRELKQVLPPNMYIPEEIEILYRWIEEQQLYIDTQQGDRIGFLFPEKELKESWTEKSRKGGTTIEFMAGGVENLRYWFGQEHEELKQRLCVFAKSGAEGSECALWLTNEGEIKIVHMGSGSGSTLACVLADNALDFIRLIAIGYDEICWDEAYPFPPNEYDDEFMVEPNVEFQKWVQSTFNVEIPKTALEIVKFPTSMDDDNSEDAFFNWSKKFIA